MSACAESQSTIFPLPSSPHWDPTTTTFAMSHPYIAAAGLGPAARPAALLRGGVASDAVQISAPLSRFVRNSTAATGLDARSLWPILPERPRLTAAAAADASRPPRAWARPGTQLQWLALESEHFYLLHVWDVFHLQENV